MAQESDYFKKSLEGLRDDLNNAETGPDRETFGFQHRLQVIFEDLCDLELKMLTIFTTLVEWPSLGTFTTLINSRGTSGAAQLIHNRIRNLLLEIDRTNNGNMQQSENQQTTDNKNSFSELENLLNKFHEVEIQLQKRYDNRTTLSITDEYDVQDLLRALLKIHFDDVRTEDAQASYAGGNSFIDFIIPSIKTGIECKKTRKNLKDKQLGDQLLIDIKRYKERHDCKILYCLIHDTEHFLVNPSGLKQDLEKEHEGMIVKLIIIR